MTNMLEVREYDVITCNNDYQDSPYFQYLDEKHFGELEQFIKSYTAADDHADALEFMKIGYKRNVGDVISLNSYVGIIELPSGFQIEVLPKISFGEEDSQNVKTKRLFLKMLCCLKEFEGKTFNSASLNVDRMNLYEIFINMFLQQTRNLVKHGLKSAYVQKDENLKYYKGKLMVGQHIKENLVHKERFHMRYDEYSINRAENRLIKATLLKLQKKSNRQQNVREIGQLLNSFELVDESMNYEKDFSMVNVDRATKDYELLMQWAKVFLLDKSFTTFSGAKTGKALLFPMEAVFEAYVEKWVKSVFEEQSAQRFNVSAQDQGFFLFDEPQRFQLRPDIVVRDNEGYKAPIIMDTKWKKLKPNNGTNNGISQNDMYQMYAYAKKYKTGDVWLLYPYHADVEGVGSIEYSAVIGEEEPITVHVHFVDLRDDIVSSIKKLYAKAIVEV